MKKILIIADGILAKQFLEKVMETEAGENSYTIVTYKEETLPKKRPENFKFFEFDPTSYEKQMGLTDRRQTSFNAQFT